MANQGVACATSDGENDPAIAQTCKNELVVVDAEKRENTATTDVEVLRKRRCAQLLHETRRAAWDHKNRHGVWER